MSPLLLLAILCLSGYLLYVSRRSAVSLLLAILCLSGYLIYVSRRSAMSPLLLLAVKQLAGKVRPSSAAKPLPDSQRWKRSEENEPACSTRHFNSEIHR